MFGLVPWRKGRNGNVPVLRSDDPFQRLRGEFDALFDRFFGRLPAPLTADWDWSARWGLDVDETDKEVVVRVEAPGFEPEDFDVQVTGDLLTVRAEHKEEKEGFAGRRSFQRTLTLPGYVSTDKVEARYRNGVLELRLPKTEEAQPKRVPVKA